MTPRRSIRNAILGWLPLAVFGLACFLMRGCGASDDRTVVLYASADEQFVTKVIKAFEEATGASVLVVGDTEARKTTGLVERLIAEKDRPRADVFWSSEIFMTIDLADRGLLAPHESPALKDWPAAWRDAQRRWHGFAARARVIVYAPSRVPEGRVPKSWMDLTRDCFRDRIVLADPRFGTTGGHLGAMLAYWDSQVMPGYYDAFLEGLAENHARLLPSGNAGVVDAVAKGEADVGMTDADDVWAAQAAGLKVRMVYPLHNVVPGEKGGGTLLIPNTAAIVKGGPHPDLAAQLVDFLLSEKVERMLAESDSHNIPLRPSLVNAYPQLAVSNPMGIDLKDAAAKRTLAVEKAVRALSNLTPPASSAPVSTASASKPNEAASSEPADAR